ncbi:MAG: Crp/Fnr family transcriptional regulator, partial [Oscillospiraceae bacterium]
VDRNDLSSVAKTHYPGAFFAELSLILDLPSATSVVARTRVVILAVAKEAFLELFWASPQMIRSVIALQSDRLMQAAERSASHTMIRTEGRLAFALVTLGQEGGQTGTVSVTHEFLGQYCGLARQTVTVILSEWQRQGLIETGYRKIRLLNPDGLTRIFLSDQNYRG